jgi:hypothetical protein
VRRQRPLPARIGVDEDQGRDKFGMAAVELQRHGAAPGDAGDVRRPQIERVDERRKAVRIVRENEIRGDVRRVTCARFVPGHEGELVSQPGELWLPHPRVRRGPVHKHQWRALADVLVGDLEPVRPNELHLLNLPLGQVQDQNYPLGRSREIRLPADDTARRLLDAVDMTNTTAA